MRSSTRRTGCLVPCAARSAQQRHGSPTNECSRYLSQDSRKRPTPFGRRRFPSSPKSAANRCFTGHLTVARTSGSRINRSARSALADIPFSATFDIESFDLVASQASGWGPSIHDTGPGSFQDRIGFIAASPITIKPNRIMPISTGPFGAGHRHLFLTRRRGLP